MTIACTLTSAELRARRAHLATLAERSLRSRDGHRLVFEPTAEAALRELVALEAECCPFLTLDLQRAEGELVLTITGPDEAAPIIAELFATRPRAARCPGRPSHGHGVG
jgi:hypothetical protein